MAVPCLNVQQCDSAEGHRAQVSYLCAYTAVTCSHFLGQYTDNDLSYFRMNPPRGSKELKLASDLPALGNAVQIIWQDKGFHCVRDGRVSRVQPADQSFSVFLGWHSPESLQGISGALCWNGAETQGVVTGVQRDTKSTHVWVQLVPADCIFKTNGYLSL